MSTTAKQQRPAPPPGIVIVDKPAGMTSHDVVSRCRRFFGTRKVGHAGTLDPAATGVLIIGVERGTKLLGHLSLETKAYDATIRLGAATSTDDAEGDIRSEHSASAAHLGRAELDAPVAGLTGEIMQRPSRVSAIKVDGRRAHERVRAGEDFELLARPVTVSAFTLGESRHVDAPGAPHGYFDVEAHIECSSGTYVRSLARDLGEALGVGGHLTALRRSRVGSFGLEHARTLAELEEDPELSLTLDEAILTSFPRRDVTTQEAAGLAHGRWLGAVGNRGVVAAVGPDGVPVALLEESGRRAASVFLVRPQ